MTARKVGKLRKKWTAIGLALIIISSAALALYWAFLVPIFEGPDEPAHFDYAMRIYTAGRLLRDGDPAFSPGSGEHPLTTYLCAFTNCNAIALHPYEKAPAGYGSKSFYRDLDRDAPEFNKSTRSDAPVMLSMYPFGYYTLAALWVAAIRDFSTRATASFFGMRILSSVLLTASLLLVYATCRELRMGSKRSLLFTAIFGFFPLTSFMSSYIQPDNLSLTLVMFCCYTGLLVHRCPEKGKLLLALGIGLSCLLVTKYQYYVAVVVPLAAMIIADRLSGRLRISWLGLLAVIVPSILLGSIQVWIMGGSVKRAPSSLLPAAGGPVTGSALHGLSYAFKDIYFGGGAMKSFWGNFGWLDTPLVIISNSISRLLLRLLKYINIVVLGLVLLRLGSIARRLFNAARAGRWRQALSVGASNPLMNSFFVFTVIMFMINAYSGGYTNQGRYWFPFLLPILLLGTWYAPAALPYRRIRATFAYGITTGLVLYCIFGSYYAVESVIARYYR